MLIPQPILKVPWIIDILIYFFGFLCLNYPCKPEQNLDVKRTGWMMVGYNPCGGSDNGVKRKRGSDSNKPSSVGWKETPSLK